MNSERKEKDGADVPPESPTPSPSTEETIISLATHLKRESFWLSAATVVEKKQKEQGIVPIVMSTTIH
jgi:hypothetical protein